MPWMTAGWKPGVQGEEAWPDADAAHDEAWKRAVRARMEVGVFHGVVLKNGRTRWTKVATYGRGGRLISGSATWRPLAERV